MYEISIKADESDCEVEEPQASIGEGFSLVETGYKVLHDGTVRRLSSVEQRCTEHIEKSTRCTWI